MAGGAMAGRGAAGGGPLLDSLLALAVDVAEQAGALLLERLGSVRTVDTKSSRTDMVTEVDRASEALIAARIAAARPHDGLLGEEGTTTTGTSGVRWVVDPIDGTTNYLYGLPAFSVSVAAEVQGSVAIGVVCDPSRDETFTAVRGGGARCNGVEISASPATDLAASLVGTGFSYVAGRRAEQAAVLTRVLPAVRDVRRTGSCAIDLCWVACGRLDAYYERGTQPWDHAAGALIAGEAGAEVTDLEGGAPSSDMVVAGPARLARQLRALLVAHAPG